MNHKYDFNKFVNEVNAWSGYSNGNLSAEDLEVFRSLVFEQYAEIVSGYDDSLGANFKINEYHKSKIANSELHKKIWPKNNRILSEARFQRLYKQAAMEPRTGAGQTGSAVSGVVD